MLFHVTIDKAEDGWYVIECPALPGCVSQGKSEEEALINIKEAINAWLWAEDKKVFDKMNDNHSEPFLVAV
jgi:predicted RNase H-like HicB family nuclease